jgi:hypothetical protein
MRVLSQTRLMRNSVLRLEVRRAEYDRRSSSGDRRVVSNDRVNRRRIRSIRGKNPSRRQMGAYWIGSSRRHFFSSCITLDRRSPDTTLCIKPERFKSECEFDDHTEYDDCGAFTCLADCDRRPIAPAGHYDNRGRRDSYRAGTKQLLPPAPEGKQTISGCRLLREQARPESRLGLCGRRLRAIPLCSCGRWMEPASAKAWRAISQRGPMLHPGHSGSDLRR